MARSFVYFISYDNGPIKIGKAKNPSVRLRELQTGSPYRLHVLGVMIGDGRLEGALHWRFKKYRMSGEWFERSQEIIDFISDKSMGSDAEFYRRFDHLDENREARVLLSLKEKKFEQIFSERVFANLEKHIADQLTVFWMDILESSRGIIGAIKAMEAVAKKNQIDWYGSACVRNEVRTAVRETVDCNWREAERLIYNDDYDYEAVKKELAPMAKEYLRKNKWRIMEKNNVRKTS